MRKDRGSANHKKSKIFSSNHFCPKLSKKDASYFLELLEKSGGMGEESWPRFRTAFDDFWMWRFGRKRGVPGGYDFFRKTSTRKHQSWRGVGEFSPICLIIRGPVWGVWGAQMRAKKGGPEPAERGPFFGQIGPDGGPCHGHGLVGKSKVGAFRIW